MTKDYVIYPRQSGKNMLRKALNALVAIQELHKPRFIGTESDGTPIYRCLSCIGGTYSGSCATRKLADEALDD